MALLTIGQHCGCGLASPTLSSTQVLWRVASLAGRMLRTSAGDKDEGAIVVEFDRNRPGVEAGFSKTDLDVMDDRGWLFQDRLGCLGQAVV